MRHPAPLQPSTATPAVSVVVVTWNGWHFLPGCLDALAAQSFRDFEVVLVDNGSVDGSVEQVRQRYSWVRLIENRENLGFAVANNQALEHCRSRFIALLNNDTRVDPGWLAALVDALERHPNAAGASGTIVSLDEPTRVIFTTPKVDPRSARAIWVEQPAPLCRVDGLSGSCALLRRAVIDRLGLFDPAYWAYFEETDWCARALIAGWDLLYVPEAVVAHKERGSTTADFLLYQITRNRLRFALKNFDRSALPRFALHYAYDLARTLARHLRDGRPRDNLLVARAVAWNLRHLPATLAARRRDLARIPPPRRSYNRSLPLRDRSSDGCGGLRPPLALVPSPPRSTEP